MKSATRYIIDPDLVEWVRAEAARRRCSMSQVIRDLILAEIEMRESHLARWKKIKSGSTDVE